MNIALVHYSAAPVVGGVERVMEEHARLFTAHGHRVAVLCGHGGGPEAVRFPADESPDALAAALLPVLAEQDVVFLHNVLTMPFRPALTEALWRVMDSLPGVRFVAWVHDVAACNPDYAHLVAANSIFRRAHARCEYVAVSPLRARQFADETGVQAAVIPNGIDPARVLGLPENVASFANRHRLLDGRILLLHPTRLVRRKNIGLSIAVGREFAKRTIPATVLVTAADDPHNGASRALREELRSGCDAGDGVVFVSDHLEVGDAELAALYRLADALFFPSRSEGFGLPLLEAALSWLPVFCSDIEPLRGLLREGTWYFSPDAEAGSLAERIRESLTGLASFRERKRVLRECSWDAIYRHHIALLLARR